MLKGDLGSTTVSDVLRDLAEGAATGCLHVVDPAGGAAKAYLRGGRVYAVIVPGARPQLGARLVSSGALGPEALAEALEAQRTELQGWRLGELLVHLGYVDQPVVEDFVNEQVRESLSALLPWRTGQWKFRVNERTREDVAPPVPVDELLAQIASRRSAWATIEQTVHGPDAVPVLSAAGTADNELEVDADAWSLLCKVDGMRTLTELARECGFTLYEAGQVVFTLVGAGLLEVDDDAEQDDEPIVSDLVPSDVASRLVSALSGSSSQSDVEDPSGSARGLVLPADDVSVSGSITRVSEALSALLGPATADDDVFNVPMHRPRSAVPAPSVPQDPKKVERARREAVRRERDAEELAAAQAELEAARAAEQVRRDDLLPDGHVADVVDLQTVRESAREVARLEDQRVEAEAAEAARVEQERIDAEAAAQQLAAEAERVEQERLAVEDARLEAERAEQERLAAEAAEAEAARVEQERLEAEAAAGEAAMLEAERAEQERLEAEAEAARLEDERLEAQRAEAARIEQERLTAETARQEAARAEAARQEAARAEQERQAAEAARAEQERQAAEAARAEQERMAAEAEAARLENERQAAETEAERAETAGLAAEGEAARAEQERLAVEGARLEFAEASRLEDKRAEQQRISEAVAQAEAASAAAELAAFAADHDNDQREVEHDREAQAAAFAELSASAAWDVPEPQPVMAAAATQATAPWDDEPMPSYASHDTDTASLLRELSSLGVEDDPTPSPSRPARPPSPRPVSQPAKKKKGLFGRG